MNICSILALSIAILANASANIFLKRAMETAGGGSTAAMIWTVITSATAWIGFASAGLLLISYLAAIRSLPLGPAYASVTGVTIAILTTWDTVAAGESLGLMKLSGIGLIVVGFILVVAR